MIDHVAVVGAAGKMGSGISALLLRQMAMESIQESKNFSLVLIDANAEGFEGLLHYLRRELKKYAEKNINALREAYKSRADLVDNGEMIEAFIAHAMESIRCGSSPEDCKGSGFIFEAIIEDESIKGNLLKQIDEVCGDRTYYFTNTSSIPIHILEEKAKIAHRIIGYHFYNPPLVQKLLEIIIPAQIDPKLKENALSLAKNLNKTVVIASDVAGFIGNGHFIREIKEACLKVRELSSVYSMPEAIYAVNKVTQEYLIRPMGIFQLVDYVGVDVCQHIASIMEKYLPDEAFVDEMIGDFLANKIKGGQNPDGTQKEGIFRYEKGRPVAVFDHKKSGYQPLSEVFCKEVDLKLGTLPEKSVSWKVLSQREDKMDLLSGYFAELWKMRSLGGEMAQNFIIQSRDIGKKLVDQRAARSIQDVDTVLMQGFYHLYGVETPFVMEEANHS